MTTRIVATGRLKMVARRRHWPMGRTAMGFCLVASMLLGCGPEPDIPTLLITDECAFTGPETLDEGTARLTLQRSGLGDYGAALVLIPDGHTTDELDEHFADVSPVWDERPDWVRLRYIVRVDDATANSASGDTVLMSLEPGTHALVCIDYSDGAAEVASPVLVNPTDS